MPLVPFFAMNFIDLSHLLTEDMPVYPGSDPPDFGSVATISDNGYAEKRLALFSHTGTHMDAPSHILPEGASLDTFPVDRFAGKGCLLDFSSHPGPEITQEDIAACRHLVDRSEFVLIHTGWSRYWGTDAYYTRYPVLSVDAAQWIAGFRLKGLGIDAISVDHPDSSDFPVHRLLLTASILIIENLTDLNHLPSHGFVVTVFPLRILDSDGSPVRAVAML
jgi:kynurenine formamidase